MQFKPVKLHPLDYAHAHRTWMGFGGLWSRDCRSCGVHHVNWHFRRPTVNREKRACVVLP